MAITFLDDEKEKPKGGITFLDDAGQPGIAMLQDSRPLTGEEITQFLADDPAYARRMSLKDYEELRRYKSDNPATFDAVGQALTKVGQDLSDAAGAVANNLTSPLKIVTALGRGALVGTTDLGDMIDKIITFDQAPNTYNLYRAKTNLPDNADTRKKYEELLAKDFSAFQESQDYQAGRAKVVQESDIPQLTEAASYVLDPTLAIPGAGAGKIGTIADKAIGAAVRTAGKATRFATRPVVDAVEGVAKAAAEAAGPAAKGAAAATGVTGIVMGVPGVREAAGAYAGLKTVDKAAQVAERVGESLMGQPSRVGPLEAMGRVPNASGVDRAIGMIGRRGGDAAIDVANATLGGALTGAVIGGALGFAAEGEEGLYGGIGSGLALGGLGAGLGRTYERVRGHAVAEARAADLARFTEALDEPTRDLFKKVVERDGPDQAVMVMDGAALLRSQFDDAKVTFLPDTDFKERFGASARGVQLETAGRPEIVINVDKPVSAYTFGHELFHAFDSVEQLKPKSEAIKQEIVGTFLQQPDGTFTQVKAGLLSPDEVDVAFKQYQRKLAQSGAATREWFSAQTPVEKAKLVGKELASEYMARMVTGGDVDGLLRGYDGVTRTLLDQTLMKQSEGVLRGVAERLGLGSAPVESMLFKNLKDASPTLNAMLRDVIRARRNLSERMVLAEDNGVVITPRDISKPIVAEKAVQMGVAERRPDGTVAMKPDSVLASEEAAQSQAIKTAVETAPVADPTKPHLRVVDGEVRGAGISPEQAAAIAKAPGISNKLKESLGVVSQSLAAQATPGAPNGLWVEYGAATRRVKNRLTGSYTSKYSSGIRLSQREVVPYELYISKAGNPVAKAVDVSKLRTVAADLASNGRLGPYERDIAGFLSDSVRYFDNISDPNGVRTRELPGMTEPKATFLNQYFGQQEKGGARFIRDLRLDRITEIRPTGERIAASELAWQRQKVNWMPAEKMPEGEVTSSKQGYRIISRNGKHSLYGADGQRVGIFDDKATAEARGQHDAREIFGPKEEDPARVVPTPDTDAGTVPGTLAPDAPVTDLPTKGTPFRWDEPSNGVQFMPEVDESAFKTFGPDVMQRLLNDTDTVAVIHIDRMRVGDHNGVPLQGGMFYPAIKENLAKRVLWAFNSENVARTVANRAAQNGGYVKLALMQEGNVIGNKTFTHAWFKELRDNIAAGKITEKKALREMNEVRKRYKADKEMPTGHNRDWKTLDEAQQAFLDMPQTKRGRTYFQKTIRVTKAEGEKIAYGALLAQQMTEAGFPDAIRLVDALEDKRFKGVPSGATVAILRFDPVDAKAKIGTAADHGVPEHLSYGYVLTGDIVAKMPYYNVVDQVRPELKNRLLSQAHTDFPVREIVPQSAEVAAGSINFMPDTPESRQRLQGTKVVDKDGAPLRVYHGSPQIGLSELKASDGAIFFSDSADVAKGYTAKRGIWMSKPTGEVRSAFLDVRNPLEIDALGKRNDNIPVPWQEWKPKVYGNLPANAVSVEAAAKRAKEMGHDALIVRNVIDTADTDGKKKSTVFAVFDPSQVMLHGEDAKAQRNLMPAAPDTPEFRQWFGDSKVVNEQGKPLVVYHGTTANEFDVFKPATAPGWGTGIYFTDNRSQAADDFGHGGRVIEAYVSLKNPYKGDPIQNETLLKTKAWKQVQDRFEDPKQAWEESGSFAGNVLRELGYDGVMVENSNDINGLEIVAFKQEQVKAATNQRPTDSPNINLMPEAMPNGTVYRSNIGFSVVNKEGGKFRVYSPAGVIIGVANSLEEAQRMIERKAK